jgi:hypothetical protein
MLEKLDHTFKRPVGLIVICFIKVVWGMSQMILGLGALILTWFFRRVVEGELMQKWFSYFDPRGVLDASLNFGWIVFLLGAVDLAIALGIWFGSWAVRNVGLVFFSGLSIWSLYHLSLDFSFFKILVLLFDLFTLFYFWQILPKSLKK